MSFYLGIDVGTASARAALFDREGKRAAHHSLGIQIWRSDADFVEQSSEDIWQAVCRCVREVLSQAQVSPNQIKGIGFDATCSLVLIAEDGSPITVSLTGRDEQNIVVWMDHRALREAETVNQAGNYPVFESVGGRISPEMQIPKLLWIKEHLPASWKRTAHFFDLPDYLTYRATGSLTRSACSTTCKWTYLSHEADSGKNGWCDSFFHQIGLGELAEDGYRRIGARVQALGESVGTGLTSQAAKELGLNPGTPVGVSIIDAHAGAIGMIGMEIPGNNGLLEERLALIGGTSSCHMAVSSHRRLLPGIWGPYWSAMIPGLWLNEGGQSATGALIDHVITSHGAFRQASDMANSQGLTIYEFLNARIEEMSQGAAPFSLTKTLHVYPDFHGNRSPRANPHLLGMITGLHLSSTTQDLALLYLATIQAVAYGTRHIIETMNNAGYHIQILLCCGGGTKNPLFLRQHADITGCRLVLPAEPEAVLLGAAILGAMAGSAYPTMQKATAAMSSSGRIIEPDKKAREYYEKKYNIFHRLHDDQTAYLTLMA